MVAVVQRAEGQKLPVLAWKATSEPLPALVAVMLGLVPTPDGALGRVRTCDSPLRRRELYPLSYEGLEPC